MYIYWNRLWFGNHLSIYRKLVFSPILFFQIKIMNLYVYICKCIKFSILLLPIINILLESHDIIRMIQHFGIKIVFAWYHADKHKSCVFNITYFHWILNQTERFCYRDSPVWKSRMNSILTHPYFFVDMEKWTWN